MQLASSEGGELAESLERRTKCLAVFVPAIYVLSSNPADVNFAFHPSGVDKISISQELNSI